MRGQNLLLKWCQSLELLMYVGKGLRSFHTGSIGSVGQRAAKLLADKVGGRMKKSAESTISAFGLGLIRTRAESFSKIERW